MRRLLFVLAALVAGCDTSVLEDADAVVGTWTVTEESGQTLVTSRIDQSVPDFEVEGEGAIVISGALEDRLTHLSSLYRYSEAVQGVDAEGITFVSRPGFDVGDGPYTILVLQRSANPSEALVNRVTADAETYFGGLFPTGTPPFTYRDGRLTVPPVAATAEDGSGRRVTVGGALSFPLVALRAGQETVLHVETQAVEGGRTVTFFQDGRFLEADAEGSLSGRWRREADGTVVVETAGSTRTAVLEGDALRLRYEGPAGGAGCVLECVESTAANLFAPPGSISTVRYTATSTYRRSGGA